MTYKDIKKIMLAGGQPTPGQIAAAIEHQLGVVTAASRSVAKHAGILMAAGGHPFPLPEDQKGRVQRRLALHDREMERLARLFTVRELAELAPRTAPAGLGSA